MLLLRFHGRLRVILLAVVALFVLIGVFLALMPRSRVPPSALVSLVRNRDLSSVIEMIRNVEDRYNRNYHHDWVFLSEEDFTAPFVEAVTAFTSGAALFRTIDRKKHWTIPPFIDRGKLDEDSKRLSELGVPYGGSNSYRLMCRFQAGIFASYLPEYRFYARIDPDVKLYCDTDYNIFEYMWRNNKKYGFTISLKEVPYAAEGLWETTTEYLQNRTEDVMNPNNCLSDFVGGEKGFCHFWSNFEVADLELYRSARFKDFFEFLDATGRFFYNRWGDAPVHTLAASMFLDRNQIHYFGDIGMYHSPNMNCPVTKEERLRRRCSCPSDKRLKKNDQNIFTFREQSCTPHFLRMQGLPLPNGWADVADRSVKLRYGESDPRA